MEMALLFLLFGGFWAQVVSQENLQNMRMLPFTLHSMSPSTSEALSTNSSIAMLPGRVDPKESISPWRQTPVPALSTPLGTPELFSFETPAGTSRSTPVTEPVTSQDIYNTELSMLVQKLSDVLSDPPVTVSNPVTNRTVASTSLETFKEASAPPETVTTSSTMASGSSVAITVNSKTSGPPVTMAIAGTPGSSTKISTSTPNPITTLSPHQGFSGMWLLPMVIALVVIFALIMVLRLWHQRHKGRTLSRGGILNRMMDAWAGPDRDPDEEATTGSGTGSNKCSGALKSDGCGRRPNLSNFFSRWKSSQGSLEELKPGKDPNLKGEKEPLVASEAKAVETPTSDKPQVKDGAAPQSQ